MFTSQLSGMSELLPFCLRTFWELFEVCILNVFFGSLGWQKDFSYLMLAIHKLFRKAPNENYLQHLDVNTFSACLLEFSVCSFYS